MWTRNKNRISMETKTRNGTPKKICYQEHEPKERKRTQDGVWEMREVFFGITPYLLVFMVCVCFVLFFFFANGFL